MAVTRTEKGMDYTLASPAFVELHSEDHGSSTYNSDEGRGSDEGGGVALKVVTLTSVNDVVVSTLLETRPLVLPLLYSTTSFNPGLSVQVKPHLDLLAVCFMGLAGFEEVVADAIVLGVEVVGTFRVYVGVADEALQRPGAGWLGFSLWFRGWLCSKTYAD